jgi:long-chain acyl-CoA synthetase
LHLDPWYENDNVVPQLPPIWMTEQWYGIGCHLLTANILNFTEAPETHQRDAREIMPNIVIQGARMWESQAVMIQARILGADTIKSFAFRVFMPIGYKVAEFKYQKQKPTLFWKTLYIIAHIGLFKKIKKNLGLSNARICYSNGAMLSPDALRFYHALNLPLKNLYGTTEGGALTGAKNDDIRLDTVGPVHNGAEVRITDHGELIYRQPGVFVGYYKNPEKTAEVLKDGWFYSGDSGSIRDDGHIEFIDRLKDIIKLTSGDTLAPQFIESQLRYSPYIKDAWVHAHPDRAYISAIIIINYINVGRWAGQNRVAYSTFAELSQKPEVYELVKKEIERINLILPPGTRVKKYVNLHKEFDPDEGDLTRNGKLRRTFLEERYRELIDAIYSDKTEIQIEGQIKYQDGRIGTKKTTLNIKFTEGDGL